MEFIYVDEVDPSEPNHGIELNLWAVYEPRQCERCRKWWMADANGIETMCRACFGPRQREN